MKGEVSKNAVTILVMLLVVVSIIGVSAITLSMMTNSVPSTPDIDRGTVRTIVGEPPTSTTTGLVGLVVIS